MKRKGDTALERELDAEREIKSGSRLLRLVSPSVAPVGERTEGEGKCGSLPTRRWCPKTVREGHQPLMYV
jgi:hypothetical protein